MTSEPSNIELIVGALSNVGTTTLLVIFIFGLWRAIEGILAWLMRTVDALIAEAQERDEKS